MKALEKQVGGDHYKDLLIQPAKFVRALNLRHLEGEAIYRIIRHKHKNKKRKGQIEDLKKAIHALELILELDYGE